MVGLGGCWTASAQSVAEKSPGAADAQVSELQEVTVTAQFRTENIQNVPLAVTALSGEDLAARHVTNIAQAASMAPNVTMTEPAGTRAPMLYIRGIGQFDFNLNVEPGVGTYIDDVYFGTLFGSNFSLVDVDRVEVLRGPQGTLAGGNSEGGAVKLYSKKPRGDDSGYFEAGVGTLSQTVFRGAYDFALAPNLFMRVSGASQAAGGYVDRVDFKCQNPALAGNLPSQRISSNDCLIGKAGGNTERAFRAAVRWLPVEGLEANLSADYSHSDKQPSAEVLLNVTPSFVPAAFQTLQQKAYGVVYDSRFVNPGHTYSNYATYTDLFKNVAFDPNTHTDAGGVTASVDWKLTDNIGLTSISAFRVAKGNFIGDLSFAPINTSMTLYNINHKQITQELRLNGDVGKWADWTVGGFYYNSDDTAPADSIIATSSPALGGTWFFAHDEFFKTQFAGFANGTLHFTDALSLNAGARYTHVRKVVNFHRYDGGTPPDGTTAAGYLTLGNTPPVITARPDYRVALDYQITQSLLSYVSWSTGFKAGGINARPSNAAAATPFAAETDSSVEAGLKSQLFDRRLRLNLAAFHNTYKNLQLTANSANLNGVLTLLTTNAGKATSQGVEGEAELHLTDHLRINASVGYLDFYYNDLGIAAGVAGGPCLSCKPPNAPKVKSDMGVQYDFYFGNHGTLTPRWDTSFQAKTYANSENRENAASPGYWVSNAGLVWQTAADHPWEVSVAVTNVFNRYYYYFTVDNTRSGGSADGVVARPREALLSFRKSF